MIKKNIMVLTIALTVGLLYSQEMVQESSQEISVPDVSTAIGGESFTIDENAIPDFTLVLPDVETDFLLTLDLPDVNESTQALSLNEEGQSEDSLFSLEGLLGGGYPGYFLGDIRLAQESEINPFQVHFSHISQNGLGAHPASDGYTRSDTSLYGESTIVLSDQYSLQFGAQYDTNSIGFQSKSPLFYLGSNQLVTAHSQFTAVTTSAWEFGVSAQTEWLTRYLGYKSGSSVPSDVATDSDAFGINGSMSLEKTFESIAFKSLLDYGFLMLDSLTSHRVDLDVDAHIQVNDILQIDSSLALVFSQNMSVLFPFSIAFNIANPELHLSLAGGMTSEQKNSIEVQKNYAFTSISSDVMEQSQWFSKIDASFPILNTMSLSTNLYFEKTAFNNGYLLPEYANKNSVTGLYDLYEKDVMMLDSHIGLDTSIGMVGLASGWNASWLDILPEENAHEIYVTASVASEVGTWGAQFSVVESFFKDYTPNIGVTTFVKVSPTFQIELQVHDFIKLVTGSDRNFAGSYVQDSGYIGLFARLYI